MSITINEDRIEIGIPRKVKQLADRISDSHDVKKLYKKMTKRTKKLEAVLEDVNQTFGDDLRFKAILDSHKVTI